MLSRIRHWRWVLLATGLALPLGAQTVPIPRPGLEHDISDSTPPLGELFAGSPEDASAPLSPGSGLSVQPGSELSAGFAAATLKLARGGEVRICPRSLLSLNRGNQGMMLGLGSGSIEIDYRLNPSSVDVLVTPDFDIRVAGPGGFHFAVGVNNKGDTCFKPLAGNSSGVVFAELLGVDVYGATAEEPALFPAGKIRNRTALSSECGCPAPQPVLRAEVPDEGGKSIAPAAPSPTHDVTAPLPPGRPGEAHVEVETPFVFNAHDATRPTAATRVNFASLPNVFFMQEDAQPVVLPGKAAVAVEATPTPGAIASGDAQDQDKGEPKKQKRGIFSRIKGFFGSVFRR